MRIYINNTRENYFLHLIRRQTQDVAEFEEVCIDEKCPKTAQGKELRRVQCLQENVMFCWPCISVRGVVEK